MIKKYKFIIFACSILMLGTAFYFINLQLHKNDNVFREIISAEFTKPKKLSLLLGTNDVPESSDRIFWWTLKPTSSDPREMTSVGMDKINESLLLEYSYRLSNQQILFITFYYKEAVIKETISIGYSDISDVRASWYHNYFSAVNKVKTDAQKIKKEMASSYSKHEDIVSVAEVEKLILQNKIDKTWLKAKSDFLLKDVLLKPWFEKGSQCYSFENLGNLKIERSKLVE